MDLNIWISSLSQASLLYAVTSFLGQSATIELSHVQKSIHQTLKVEIRAHYWYPYPISSGYECRIRHLCDAYGTFEDHEMEPVRPIRRTRDRTIRRRISGKRSADHPSIRLAYQCYLADIYDLVYIMNFQIFLVDHSLIALAHINRSVHWAFRSEIRQIRENWVIRQRQYDPWILRDQDQTIPTSLCTGYELRARHLQQIAESRPNPRKRIRGKGNTGSGD